jgi:hypothetical protein
MDPVTMIVSALAAGAASALSDTGAEAVRDAYAGLKELIRRRFGESKVADTVLDEHEKAPDVWKAPLEQQLRASSAGDDQEVLEAARRILALTDPEGTNAGKYRVIVTGGQVGAIGDHADVKMGGSGTA